jgi:D-proline reductase (dithiol) PrdB
MAHAAADPQGRCPPDVRQIEEPKYTAGDAPRVNTGRGDTVIEPSASLRKFLRALQGRRLDEVPWAPLSRPLADCRLAVVASSVCLVHGDPHEYVGVEIGDPSFREIDNEVDIGELLARSRGRAGDGAANLERNIALALAGLRAAVAEGRLGELNRRHLALYGPVAATVDAIRKKAPQAAAWLTADQVDVALLVPT